MFLFALTRFVIATSMSFAQIPATSPITEKPNSKSQQVYEIREALFKRTEKTRKISNERKAELKSAQDKFRVKRKTVSEDYQVELKKIEQEERTVTTEINKRFDAQLKEINDSSDASKKKTN